MTYAQGGPSSKSYRRLEHSWYFTFLNVLLIHDIEHDFCSLVPSREGFTDVFLLRIAHADPPTARSLRRPVDDILTLQGDA